MTSVVYVDLCADSEDETPPDRKRPRLDASAGAVAPKTLQVPVKLVSTSGARPAPTAAKTVAATGAKQINLPSSITVTKHKAASAAPTATVSNGAGKTVPVQWPAGQKIAWSTSKAPTSTSTITTVSSNAVKVAVNSTVAAPAPKVMTVVKASTAQAPKQQVQVQQAPPKTTQVKTLVQQNLPKPVVQLKPGTTLKPVIQQKVVNTSKPSTPVAAQKLLVTQKVVTPQNVLPQKVWTTPKTSNPLNQVTKPGTAPNQVTKTITAPNQINKPASAPNQVTKTGSAPNQMIKAGIPFNQMTKAGTPSNLVTQAKPATPTNQITLTKQVTPTNQIMQAKPGPPTNQITKPGTSITQVLQPKPAAPQNQVTQPKFVAPQRTGNSRSALAQKAKPAVKAVAPGNSQPPQLVALQKQATPMPSQKLVSPQQQLVQQRPPVSPKLPLEATATTQKVTVTMKPMPSSSARTLPFRQNTITSAKPATPPLTTSRTSILPLTSTVHSLTASATPPQRLLATPPHCAAALNEPLLLNLPPTTSITPQLTPTTTPPPLTAQQRVSAQRPSPSLLLPGASISPVAKDSGRKRINPITVLKKSDEAWRQHIAQTQYQQTKPKPATPAPAAKSEEDTPVATIVLVESPPTTPPTEKGEIESSKPKVVAAKPKSSSPPPRAPFVPEYEAFLKLLHEKDKSSDMERLIETKLKKYYYSVHENFVRSRGFRKMLEAAMDRIRAEPDMVYIHLKSVVDELKVRRKAKAVAALVEDEEEQKAPSPAVPQTSSTSSVPSSAPAPTPLPLTTSTGNKRTDERIRKLSRTLYTITKRISALEQAEVDWNDDDHSSYLQVERYKKRACQIYEKICDLTGESKSAHRQLKQPILFKDSAYPQFNRTLSAFVNRMHEFPDYHDVLQLLEHCNKEKSLGLATFEMKRIAHEAFIKVGKLLQARRKTDLYETVTHFTANAKDPAATDPELLAKLNDNNKNKTRISDVLDKFAREQDLTAEEQREARLKEKLQQQQQQQDKETAETNAIEIKGEEKPSTSKEKEPIVINAADEEYDDSEDDESDAEDVDDFVDNFKINGDLSDVDSEPELVEETPAPSSPAKAKTTETRQSASSLPNGRLKQQAAAPNVLKIMSVSSLNATVHGQKSTTATSKRTPAQNLATKIAAEIVISDEES